MSGLKTEDSYGLNVGDLIQLNKLAPGVSSAPGLILSLPDELGQIDILIEGTKRTVHWNQVLPIIKLCKVSHENKQKSI